jgi:hypothetical protein
LNSGIEIRREALGKGRFIFLEFHQERLECGRMSGHDKFHEHFILFVKHLGRNTGGCFMESPKKPSFLFRGKMFSVQYGMGGFALPDIGDSIPHFASDAVGQSFIEPWRDIFAPEKSKAL